MSVHGVEVGASDIHSTQDEVGPNVALVVEQMLFQHTESCTHTRLQGGGEIVLRDIRTERELQIWHHSSIALIILGEKVRMVVLKISTKFVDPQEPIKPFSQSPAGVAPIVRISGELCTLCRLPSLPRSN